MTLNIREGGEFVTINRFTWRGFEEKQGGKETQSPFCTRSPFQKQTKYKTVFKNLFSFSSDKDRRTDSRIRRKNTAQPRRESHRGRPLRILVARSNHWAMKPQWKPTFTKLSVLFPHRGDPDCPSLQARSEQRKLSWFISAQTRPCRDHFLSNSLLFQLQQR